MVQKRNIRKSYSRNKRRSKGIEFFLIDSFINGITFTIKKIVNPIFRGFSIGRISYTNNNEKVKSNAEKQIANYLKSKGVRYIYEYPIHIRPGFNIKPDFYLPDFDVYIEYWGLLNHPTKGKKYRKDMTRKKALYHKRSIRVISLDHTHYNSIESTLATTLSSYIHPQSTQRTK